MRWLAPRRDRSVRDVGLSADGRSAGDLHGREQFHHRDGPREAGHQLLQSHSGRRREQCGQGQLAALSAQPGASARQPGASTRQPAGAELPVLATLGGH